MLVGQILGMLFEGMPIRGMLETQGEAATRGSSIYVGLSPADGSSVKLLSFRARAFLSTLARLDLGKSFIATKV